MTISRRAVMLGMGAVLTVSAANRAMPAPSASLVMPDPLLAKLAKCYERPMAYIRVSGIDQDGKRISEVIPLGECGKIKFRRVNSMVGWG